jgi:hypothetical protein
MSDLAERLPVRLAQAWVALYTRGLPADRRDARRAEISSDLWEQCHDGSRDGSASATASVLGRVLAGALADISWRVEERGFARKVGAMDASWYGQQVQRRQIIIIPGISVLVGVVTLAGLSGAAAALLAGLMALALVGLTRGLMVSPVGSLSGKGTHMETGISINQRRRKTLLIVLGVSVIVLAGTYAYAMSLEDWGDTREVIFPVVSLVSLAVGLGALILLVANIARARRS